MGSDKQEKKHGLDFLPSGTIRAKNPAATVFPAVNFPCLVDSPTNIHNGESQRFEDDSQAASPQ
jgi:hypothetical protein